MRISAAALLLLAAASVIAGASTASAAPLPACDASPCTPAAPSSPASGNGRGPSETWPGKAPEQAEATKAVSGSATAYDVVVDGESYRAAVSQSFDVKLVGRNAPRFVPGSFSFDRSGSYGSKVASASISGSGPSVSSGGCAMLPVDACLTVRTPVHGVLTTAYGNTYTQDGVLVTEVGSDGSSVTTLNLGGSAKA